YASRTEGSGLARAFWRDEYRLNALIAAYPKPYVALQDGIVMGGGIGLSGHASHRIVTERSQLAMPETGIGLIPDVGGTWLLANAPGEIGIYLGLTGETMRAADAIYARFSDALVPMARLPALVARLTDPGGGVISEVIREMAEDPGESELQQHRGAIDQAFAGDSIEAIEAALESVGDPWAATTLAKLAPKSPKALRLTLAAVRQARRLQSLEDALKMEYRLTVRLFEDGEFPEGVRALLVDKDHSPKWSPEPASPEFVKRYLEPLAPGEELAFGTPST
ncbi:MAG TPA: 3-hydroxyisobutyryl-CoA hydrolase, partial [Hyphomicrobiaceae bacterium]|nr:3-hydroxyisobutyryl-CoA hydrolase [Hyphomicrobiaceae bacterium]